MALTAAILGWMFDGLEMGLFPLVGRPALQDLLTTSDEGLIGLWFGVMIAGFLVGAATGGVLFGWLGDRIGRVRAMTLSVLAYSLFTGMCGLAWNVESLFFFRFIASLGMGGEWSLGVSLVMEVWPNRSRAWLAGLIGAASNVGFVSIAVVSLSLTTFITTIGEGIRAAGILPEAWVAELLANSGWRLLMLIGALPALLTFFIRLFVPESERWLDEQSRGATSHWATRDLLGVVVGACGALAIVYVWAWPATFVGDVVVTHSWLLRLIGSILGLIVAILGFLYPVLRYQRRSGMGRIEARVEDRRTIYRMLLGACLSGVALLGTWGSIQWAPTWADHLTEGRVADAKAYTQIFMGLGAIIGTIAAALIGEWLGRRITYSLLCLGSLASALVFFQLNEEYNWWFLASVFLAGGITASFYGWLPLYLPELFATRVRATGQGFAFNFGRILAAMGALQAGILMNEVFGGDYARACSLMSLIYLVGLVIIWFGPETKAQPLPA